ncbi:uncharacterized protein LOC111351471 [Spodoptera litura]|uniref:Uncharacterized protein LOC111351471 n=1 Tax=Spodoptera litura TaxID=69820 RepID=A0A9J7DVE0_SPOLT|nr:uncharacterized protein LOC111351471 [Spodoptera litura]
MICVKVFLFFACILVAYAAQCTTATYGKITNNKHSTKQLHLGPGLADWTITVDPMDKEKCPDGIVGLKVKACDTDVPPTIGEFISVYEFSIHRHGDLKGQCVVDIKVYC